jgi:NADH-quinone oxidoreductase subunit N
MPTEITVPSIAYGALSPMLIVFGAAVIGVLVESFAPAERRRGLQIVTCAVGLLAALVAVVLLAGTHQLTIADAIAVDGPALFLQGTIVVLGLAGILLISEQSLDSSGGSVVASAATLPGSRDDVALAESTDVQTEVYPLALFSIGGMMLFPASNDLITLFIALEIVSLPLYLMAGLARRRRLLSQEAAVKYFLLGAFSSAFFLYGVALLYGYAAGTTLGDIRDAGSVAGSSNELLLYLGLGMLVVGLLFKVGAVPFQAWTPDVYQGSPTPVTALMAACVKVSAFGALLRVLYVAFGNTAWDWRPVLWAVAIATMVVGALLAVTQTDVKRMLAYSSVAHTGFILVGVIALGDRGLSSTLFYLLAYGFTTLAAFAVVTLVRDASGEATHLARWAGLGRKSPLVAATFAFLLFALAGIPLTSGFMAKFAVFTAGIEGGATALVVVGVVTSAVTAFFYARVVVLMFFTDPPADGPTVAVPSGYTAGAIALGLAVTVVLGVLPQPALDLAESAALFVR